MNISPFIAVVQLVSIIAYIVGADPGDLITRLPPDSGRGSDNGNPGPTVPESWRCVRGRGPQLLWSEMGCMEQFVKRFNVRKLEFCNLIAGEDGKDKTELELEGTAAKEPWRSTAGTGAEILYLGSLCV